MVHEQQQQSAFSALSIIVPTLNEAETISPLINALRKQYPGVCILVSDDNSPDDTASVVEAFAENKSISKAELRVLRRSCSEAAGLSGSVADALAEVQTEYFCLMDADFQHPPEKIEEMFRVVRNETADGAPELVVAARRPKELLDVSTRSLATKFFGLLGRRCLAARGMKLSDPLSGFFLMKTELAQEIINQSPERIQKTGYKFLFDLLMASPEPIMIQEVPFKLGKRMGGSSKLKLHHAICFLRTVLKQS